MTRALFRRGLVIAALVLSATACDKEAAAPTAATAATLQSLIISGLPPELSIGDRAQMTARAGWSDGRSEDVSARTRWTSRSLACLITASGAVTGNEPGDCSIDASFESRSATASVRVSQARTFDISGVVREKYELREPPIPGAIVTVMSGAQAGRSTTGDQAGRYTLARVPLGTVTLRVEAPAFEAVTLAVSSDSPAVDVFLPPEMITLSWDSRTGGVAPAGAAEFTVPFRTSHRGYVTLSVYSSRYECGTYETFGAYVRERHTTPEWLSVSGLGISPCLSYRTGVPELKSVPLPPGDYQFRMWRLFADSWLNRINIVSVTHPR